MTNENDYLERVKGYQVYLKKEIESYKRISDEESLRGSIAADGKVSLLEANLGKLESDFPELKK